MIRIFFDTEFCDFLDPDLISIGLVAEDDRQFYGERSDFRMESVSQFVRETVLPQLRREPARVYTRRGLRDALRAWLAQFEATAPVVLCADYEGDWLLLQDLLQDRMPKWVAFENVYEQINDLVLEDFFRESRLAQHHALNDAIANKFAYRPKSKFPAAPDPVRIFIDIEFTDLIDMDLISIGMVSDTGQQFYGEVSDFDSDKCSAFVREAVLPQLGKRPELVLPKTVLAVAARAWLESFAPTGAVLCFDFVGDYGLLRDLLDEDVPAWLRTHNIKGDIDEVVKRQYFQDTGLLEHHALNDAFANRFAYRPKRN